MQLPGTLEAAGGAGFRIHLRLALLLPGCGTGLAAQQPR